MKKKEERRKRAEHQRPPLPASWLWTPCDQPPYASMTSCQDSLSLQIVNQNRTCFPTAAFVRYFITATKKVANRHTNSEPRASKQPQQINK